jgi:hypothetical protein
MNEDFCGITTTLLASASIQSGDLDCAELYCHQALKYPSTDMIAAQISELLRVIPQLKMFVQYMGLDRIHQLIDAGLQFGQELVSQIDSHWNIISQSNNQSIWTYEKTGCPS